MPADEQDLAFLQAVLLTALECADEGLLVLDAGGRCRMIGRRAGEMFGIDATRYVGKPGVEVLEAFAKACDDPDAFWHAAAAPLGSPATEAEVEVRHPFPRTVLCRAIALASGVSGAPGAPAPFAGSGKAAAAAAATATATATRERTPSGRLIFVRDVTFERAAETSTEKLRARLRALVPFDALTGLLNQRRLYEELGREHSRSSRAWDSYALLRLDVDGMRSINEAYGAPAGDQLLEQIARRLETCIREYDVLARLDGDEFGVLLPGADGVAAGAVGARMAGAIADPGFILHTSAPAAWRVGQTEQAKEPREARRTDEGPGSGEAARPSERAVTVSIGVALWIPPSRETAEGTFRAAGEALAQARKAGGARMHVYGAP